ncbi:MAG: cytochrome c oxidase subunit II [Deltaproteobacteria bacterium]|nr:MAG: cytochrome c oxidase subunit II [Deltaproteobacteria bacterium]
MNLSTILLAMAPAEQAAPPPNDAQGGPWSMPIQASTFAPETDAIYLFILVLSLISFVGIVGATLYFMKAYRRRSADQKTSSITHNGKVEFLWSAIPAVLLVVIFLWSEVAFMKQVVPPPDAIDIRVKGQKWFWTAEYPANPGVQLNNEIIVPVGVPVRVTLTSQDVIHSFFIPAFRVKRDAVPGRYTTVWFEATRPGRYNLFCAEYCGDQHSEMRGVVHVLPADEYEAALAEAGRLEQEEGESLAAFGERIYVRKGCNACHSTDGTTKTGPSWKGMYGAERTFADGSSGTVDDNYIRESILEPNAKVVSGFTPQMPSFQGQLNDDQITALIEFMKTLK